MNSTLNYSDTNDKKWNSITMLDVLKNIVWVVFSVLISLVNISKIGKRNSWMLLNLKKRYECRKYIFSCYQFYLLNYIGLEGLT